jgi:hypothetical protein
MSNQDAKQPRQFDQGIAHRLRLFSESLIRYAVDWIDEKRYIDAHRRYIEEIERNGDLGAFLERLDVTREQLHAFAISPLASAELLTRMLERIGIADEQIPVARGKLVEQCRLCENWRLCRRWLDRGGQNEEYRTFCANADLFDRLRCVLSERP